jgi:hypothetical protein
VSAPVWDAALRTLAGRAMSWPTGRGARQKRVTTLCVLAIDLDCGLLLTGAPVAGNQAMVQRPTTALWKQFLFGVIPLGEL